MTHTIQVRGKYFAAVREALGNGHDSWPTQATTVGALRTELMARELRERVHFQQANLMQPLPALPLFDVIFLRNVLIYFDNDAKAQIVRRVLTQLKPDGVLYTGHAESLSTLALPVRALATAIHGHA